MAQAGKQLIQFYRGASANAGGITPLEAEPVYETDTFAVKLGDGVSTGAHRIGLLPRANQTVVNAATPLVGGAWTAIPGLSVTLPDAGQWVVQGLIGYELQLTDAAPRADDAEVLARFVNVTQGGFYSSQARHVLTTDNEWATDAGFFKNESMFEVITTTVANDVIGVEVFRSAAPTWTLATAGLGSNITFLETTSVVS